MVAHDQTEEAAGETATIARTAELLGGARVLHRRLRDPFEVHEALNRGLPRKALMHLIGAVSLLHDPAVLKATLGISLRTSQRMKATSGGASLAPEQSGRAWKFAEILVEATKVFGSQEDAERWLLQPAMALDRRRPIDLLATPAGTRLVEDLLGRIEYGVYT